jgi:uncharacterized membrane protein
MTGPSAARRDASPITWMELMISYVLRWGVLLSGAVIVAGISLFAWNHHTGYAGVAAHHLSEIVNYPPRSTPAGFFPTAPRVVLGDAIQGKPYAVIAAGLLLLIATPVVRVGLSLVFFLVERDWLYLAITATVLLVLLYSLFAGIG